MQVVLITQPLLHLNSALSNRPGLEIIVQKYYPTVTKATFRG